jgi:hypothetical protein
MIEVHEKLYLIGKTKMSNNNSDAIPDVNYATAEFLIVGWVLEHADTVVVSTHLHRNSLPPPSPLPLPLYLYFSMAYNSMTNCMIIDSSFQ